MTTRSFVLLFFSAAAFGAKPPVNPVNANADGVAIKGYDAVAYFTQSQPVKGDSRFSYQWMGATWHFASAENRDAFEKTPDKYAPQFGGYCSWAVSQGHTADIDPSAWRIIEGKLYLNYNKDIQKKWSQDVQKRIEDANQNWPRLHK